MMSPSGRLVTAVTLTCLACGTKAPPPAPPDEPYPEKAPDDMPAELGWRYGGCAWDTAQTLFGDVALDAPTGPLQAASLVCRVEALVPGRAGDRTLFSSNDGDVPDLIVGAHFGAGPTFTRRAPNDQKAGLFVYAPVTLAAGDVVAFYAKDYDTASDDDWLGDVRGTFTPDARIALASDSLTVACAPVPPARRDAALADMLPPLETLLATFGAAQPALDPPGYARPGAAYDAHLMLRCMSALAGSELPVVRAVLDRHRAAEERWQTLVRQLIDADARAAVRPSELPGTPLSLSLGAARCGVERLPDTEAWGISSGNRAADGTSWCFVPLTLTNTHASPVTVAGLADPARTGNADTVGFFAWAGTTRAGAHRTCNHALDDTVLAPGQRMILEVACMVKAGDALRSVRAAYRFGVSGEHTLTLAVD